MSNINGVVDIMDVLKIPETFLSEHPEVLDRFGKVYLERGRKFPEVRGEAFIYAVDIIAKEYGQAVAAMVRFHFRYKGSPQPDARTQS